MGGIGSGAKPKVYPADMVSAVARLYEDGLIQSEIAERLGVTQKVIWNLMRRHELPRRIAAKREQRGEKNASWRGDAAGYQGLHRRLYAKNVSRCDECGTTDPTKHYEWANLTGRYADEDDYRRMCRSCHRRYDNARRQEVMPNA